ncbi:MAG: transposase, partial [Planctomycetota bacterium]
MDPTSKPHSLKFIALDVHKSCSEMAVLSAAGTITQRRRLPTAVPPLVEAVRQVARPRRLTFEEGPLADWLARALRPHVDALIVCDARRNHWVAKEGDKTDPVDAEKLARLFRGGFLKPVHQVADPGRSALKRAVGLYHDQVRRRVRLGNQLTAILARHGRFVSAARLADPDDWRDALDGLPNHRLLRASLERLHAALVQERERERAAGRELTAAAKNVPVVRRFAQVPGVAWIRGVTFYAALDTPERFRNKSALWKYCGLGLRQRQSGSGQPQTHLSKEGNRRLKDLLIGAAETSLRYAENPFAD